MAAVASPDWAPANDALLVQPLRGALGKDSRGWRRINGSSCPFVVTLHGVADSNEERYESRQPPGRRRGSGNVANRLKASRY